MPEWGNQWENFLRNPPMFAHVSRRPNRLGATQDQARELRAPAQASRQQIERSLIAIFGREDHGT
jgi:hypothetical protein